MKYFDISIDFQPVCHAVMGYNNEPFDTIVIELPFENMFSLEQNMTIQKSEMHSTMILIGKQKTIRRVLSEQKCTS